MTEPSRAKLDPRVLTVRELLAGYSAIMAELRRREIVRSSNNPVSDYAEVLFCRAFGWVREKNSAAGYDARDASGTRYQIKARRMTPQNGSRQLGAIRKLDDGPFDQLAGVLFDEEFQVLRAILVPLAVVRQRSVHVAYTSSWRFLLHDDTWLAAGIRDVTEDLWRIAPAVLDGAL